MSKKTVLCADSTCDLGDELRERYHVQYFPFHVIRDGQTYSDGVDLVPAEIYRAYREKNILPKTAAINTAKSGFFSSDRTISEYNRSVWKLEKLK